MKIGRGIRKKAIKEIQRVSSGNAFIQVDAYRNENELEIFKDWMLKYNMDF